MTDYALYNAAINWFDHMLLSGKLRLKDVPQEIRIFSHSLYSSAFRVSRSKYFPVERFIEDLAILVSDTLSGLADANPREKDRLLGDLSTQFIFNEHKDSEVLDEYKKNLPKRILYELQGHGKFRTENIRTQLEEQGFI